ncbi:MAG: hypothetical protein JWN03_4030 [Nocardia sp.]|uniref:hypothetical protein n=1 Tax=Nocardia sp. TaxID=1821 RepID=UPI002619622D|nr:hypothetical protein [Nocardia sp.]MCU1643755.1 hypothetical protein [Nocardia sp.]
MTPPAIADPDRHVPKISQLSTLGAGGPAIRFHAIALVAIVRSITAPEIRAQAEADPGRVSELIEDWLDAAVGYADRSGVEGPTRP